MTNTLTKHHHSTLFYILLILTIAWFGVMTWLSHQNGTDTGRTSKSLAQEILRIFHIESDSLGDDGKLVRQLNGGLRKAAHIVVFAILTVLVLSTLSAGGYGGTCRIVALILLILWCWGDEATKPFIVGRHFSWLDTSLNVLGVILGNALISGVCFLLHLNG